MLEASLWFVWATATAATAEVVRVQTLVARVTSPMEPLHHHHRHHHLLVLSLQVVVSAIPELQQESVVDRVEGQHVQPRVHLLVHPAPVPVHPERVLVHQERGPAHAPLEEEHDHPHGREALDRPTVRELPVPVQRVHVPAEARDSRPREATVRDFHVLAVEPFLFLDQPEEGLVQPFHPVVVLRSVAEVAPCAKPVALRLARGSADTVRKVVYGYVCFCM